MADTDYRARIYDHYSSGRHEQLAPDSTDQMRQGPYLRRMIARHFPSDHAASIIDLGCGHGTLVHFAHEMGYERAIGIDRSAEQVEAAHRLGIEGISEGDVLLAAQKLPEASQDVVIAFDVIEHLRREELLPLVDAVRRVLKPGGRWIIHTLNGESPFFGRIRYGDFTHEEGFTRTSIGQLLLSSGFTEVRCYEDAPIVHGVKSALRNLVWRVIRGLLSLYLTAETGTSANAIFTQNFLTVATK